MTVIALKKALAQRHACHPADGDKLEIPGTVNAESKQMVAVVPCHQSRDE